MLEANSTRVQTALVASGVGCSVLPYSAIAEGMAAGRLSAVPIEGLSVTWTLVHSKERTLGLAAQRLLDTLLEVTLRAAESGCWPGMALL